MTFPQIETLVVIAAALVFGLMLIFLGEDRFPVKLPDALGRTKVRRRVVGCVAVFCAVMLLVSELL